MHYDDRALRFSGHPAGMLHRGAGAGGGERRRLLAALLAALALMLVGSPALADNTASVTVEVALSSGASPVGVGTVTSVPAALECPSRCSGRFATGTKVALHAVAEKGYEFGSWAAPRLCSEYPDVAD